MPDNAPIRNGVPFAVGAPDLLGLSSTSRLADPGLDPVTGAPLVDLPTPIGFDADLFRQIPVSREGFALPGTTAAKGNVHAVAPQALQSPLAAMHGVKRERPESEEWAQTELAPDANLRGMFPHATNEPAELLQEAGRAMDRGDDLLRRILDEKRAGLTDDEILHGRDGKGGVMAVLDPTNEASGRFSHRLMTLANAVLAADHPGASTADEMRAIRQAAIQANWSGIHYMAPGDSTEARAKRHELKQLFKEEFGISSPDAPHAADHYMGQGAFGSVINHEAKDAIAPQFSFANDGSPRGERGKRIVDVARSQVGVREATGHNDGIPNQRYMEGRAPEPWCSDFVKWCMKQVDPALAKKYGSPSCNAAIKKFGQYGHYKKRGTYTPRPGDVIFFGSHGKAHHTGIVVGVKDGYVETIEGNSSNMVARRRYKLGSSKILGYGDTQEG